jgi:hypothetical protein
LVGTAVKVTGDPAQIVVLVPVILTEAGVVEVTDIVTALLVAVVVVTHVSEVVITHVTISLSTSVLEEYVGVPDVTNEPLTYHW